MRYIIAIFILIALTGCNKSDTIVSEKIYEFTSQTSGIVKQNGMGPKNVDTKYILSLKGFNPSGKEFDAYNSQYSQTEDVKHIEITNKTKIYNHEGNLVDSPYIIGNGVNIKFTVQIVDSYFLEALTIYVLD
jgi:hypothetical protein